MRSGYFFAGSNVDGFSIQPSRVTPPPTSTVKNSTGFATSGASATRSAVVSVSVRSTR